MAQSWGRNKFVEKLHAKGFDKSYTKNSVVFLRCSQCEALIVNGTPTHETGCPNTVNLCAGCGAVVEARQRFCSDCG